MYSVFIQQGRGSDHPSLQFGHPFYGDAKSLRDVRWLGVDDHHCAMSIKRTLERMGDMIRSKHHSLFVELLGWALMDAKEIGSSNKNGHAVAKQIWDEWSKSRRNRISHKSESFSDNQRLELAMAYINSRAGAFLLQHGDLSEKDVAPLVTPIGILYKNGHIFDVTDLQRTLKPDSIIVRRITIGKHHIEQPDLSGDTRFSVINPSVERQNNVT